MKVMKVIAGTGEAWYCGAAEQCVASDGRGAAADRPRVNAGPLAGHPDFGF